MGQGKYKPYPKYKPSGVEWIGEIPEGWEVRKNKFLNLIQMGQSPKSEKVNQNNNGIPFLQGNAEFGIIHPQNVNWCTELKKICKMNDILLSVRAPIGEINIANKKYCIGRGLCSITPKKQDITFLYYNLKACKIVLQNLGLGSTFTAISNRETGNFIFPLPPLPEQQAISSFLDRETTRIDTIITKQTQMIELLKEKRSALITHAVTRGLSKLVSKTDPDFADWAKPVKYKSSGVEWIGEIPEEWKIQKLKFIAKKINTGSTPKTSIEKYYNGNIPWYTPDNFNENKYLSTPSKFISQLAIKDNEAIIFPINSLFFVGIGATIGKISIITQKASCNQQINIIQINTNIPSYYYYCFKALQNEIIKFACFTTLPIFNQTNTSNIIFPLPPLPEQKAITSFLDHETTKIDSLITKIEKQIGLLKEYKQSLITHAVTGKIDVRDVS